MQRFSKEWTLRYAESINQDSEYKKNGDGWKEPIRFVAVSDKEIKAVWLNLVNGVCVQALSDAEALQAHSNFEIRADVHVWDSILNTNADPLVALLTGKLSLSKGSLFTLSRYTSSAKDLVRLAAHVKTESENKATEKEKTTSTTEQNSHIESKNASLVTLTRRIDTDSFPWRLYEKAKVLGIWNPSLIDFSQDKLDWNRCSDVEKEVLLHLTSLFQSGEESVTNEIVPLLLAVSREGRLEEEIYLTTFLFEEAKHTDFFNRVISELFECNDSDLARFKSEPYAQLFDVELNTVMRTLLHDSSPENQLIASVTYNLVVEGSLAETGYHAYFKMLQDNDLMPGIRKGIHQLKLDESRHIAYGIYLISRIMIAHPHLKPVFEERMSKCMELVVGIIHALFERYPVMPFGLKAQDFIEFASDQFQKRYERIEKSLQNQTPFAEVM